MPTSHNTNVDYVSKLIRDNHPKTILDVGAGAGKYGHIVRALYENRAVVDAIEVWDPYIDEYKLNYLYDNVIKIDVRDFVDFDYDMVILGDILEHMTKDEAVSVMQAVKEKATTAIISIPICHFPQGHVHGNPYEEHVKDDWSHDEVMQTFSNIYEFQIYSETATYFLKYR